MRKGEKWVFAIMGISVAVVMARNIWTLSTDEDFTKGIPFYSTATGEVADRGPLLYKEHNCKDCHSLWTVRNIMRKVPAPKLDGIGSLRDEQWFYRYLSAEDPQSILPSRLKEEFQMPSYAHLPDEERRILAKYMASLKVEDYYLEEVKKDEYEVLTGKDYPEGKQP